MYERFVCDKFHQNSVRMSLDVCDTNKTCSLHYLYHYYYNYYNLLAIKLLQLNSTQLIKNFQVNVSQEQIVDFFTLTNKKYVK